MNADLGASERPMHADRAPHRSRRRVGLLWLLLDGVAAVPPNFRRDAVRRHVPQCASGDWTPAVFVRAYLINVDHAHNGERFSLMALQLNKSCVPWSLWPGVVPDEATFDQLGHFFPQNIRKDRANYLRLLAEPRSRGMMGNYLSHLTLWEHLVAQEAAAPKPPGGAASYLIMEDDVWLDPRWVAKLHEDTARATKEWDVLQAVWFGAYYESAATSTWVDEVHKALFTASTLQYPGVSHEEAVRMATDGHNESASERKKGISAYLGLQVSLVRSRGLSCLLERLPLLNVKSVPCVDSMSITTGCPRRFALRAGNSNSHNWGHDELLGWHTTKWVRDVQLGVYRADEARATGCGGLGAIGDAKCTDDIICRSSGSKYLTGNCSVFAGSSSSTNVT